MNIVVGSGPAGVACAAALLDGGEPVTMIDAGLQHEDEGSPDMWTGLPGAVRHDQLASAGKHDRRLAIPDKLAYGSDFPYRRHPAAIALHSTGTGLKSSFAVGGLSTVWGSAVLPYAPCDIAEWPITVADLREGYTKVTKLVPVASVADDLETSLPTWGLRREAMPLSEQSRRLLDRMTRRRDRLRTDGIVFGRSRLAVERERCDLRGACLRGCPNRAIYSAAHSIPGLKRAGLTYETGLVVRAFREVAGGVELDLVSADGTPRRITGRRAFLGAGVINTAEITLRSLSSWNRSVRILDSQYFIAPALLARGTRDVDRERLHTLSQLFIELLADAGSPHGVHLQVYSYSDILRETLAARLGRLGAFAPMAGVLGRLMVLQGYLHSMQSGSIELTLAGDAQGERLDLVGRPDARSRTAVRSVMRRLLRAAPQTHLLPLLPLVEVAEPGRGFHSGGTFPMARHPRRGGTDLFGRPAGLSNIHLIDASTFPSIPATTITLSVMANAYRIGAAVARGELS